MCFKLILRLQSAFPKFCSAKVWLKFGNISTYLKIFFRFFLLFPRQFFWKLRCFFAKNQRKNPMYYKVSFHCHQKVIRWVFCRTKMIIELSQKFVNFRSLSWKPNPKWQEQRGDCKLFTSFLLVATIFHTSFSRKLVGFWNAVSEHKFESEN